MAPQMTVDSRSPALGDLVRALTALDYSTALVQRSLGRAGYADASAGSPGGALWHLDRRLADGDVGARDALLAKAIFLREPVPAGDLESMFGADLVGRLTAAAALQSAASGPDQTRLQVDIRPVRHEVHGDNRREVLIVSDPDASLDVVTPKPGHVPGVGQAPLTLLNQVPSGRVDRLLDLGTGSGVLALVLDAEYTVATDVHARALGYAAASARSGATAVEWRHGSWFSPVENETFDRIVSNPPFVVGPAVDGQIYRDAGLDLDGASRTVVEGAAAHLAPGGTAHLLCAWSTTLSESASSRVAGWLPDHGIRAWVIQRDRVSPSTYVRTWTKDASVDLRSPEGRRRSIRWLDYFAEHDIVDIGMGYVHLQRIDGPSEVTFETVDSPDLGFFGDEVTEYFLRAEWLAHRNSTDILDSRFRVRPGLARECVELPASGGGDAGQPGFHPEVIRLTRTDGPRFSHDIDAALSAIIAGLSPVGLTLRDVAELYCTVNGIDVDELAEALVPLIVDLVRHGMVLPADLIATEGEST